MRLTKPTFYWIEYVLVERNYLH